MRARMRLAQRRRAHCRRRRLRPAEECGHSAGAPFSRPGNWNGSCACGALAAAISADGDGAVIASVVDPLLGVLLMLLLMLILMRVRDGWAASAFARARQQHPPPPLRRALAWTPTLPTQPMLLPQQLQRRPPIAPTSYSQL
eukprot:3503672-Pleurochrysis_carterae.AAC.1